MQFVQEVFGLCISGSQTIMQMEKLDGQVLGGHGKKWCVDVSPAECTAELSELIFEGALNLLVTTLVDIFTVRMPTAHLLKTVCDIGTLCDKTAHFRVAFYCDRSKAHLCTNHGV